MFGRIDLRTYLKKSSSPCVFMLLKNFEKLVDQQISEGAHAGHSLAMRKLLALWVLLVDVAKTEVTIGPVNGSAVTAVCVGGVMKRADGIVGSDAAAQGKFRDYYKFELLDKFVFEVLNADAFFYVTAPHDYVASDRLKKYIGSSKRVQVFQWDNRSHPLAFATRLRMGHKNKTFLPYLVQGRSLGSPFKNQYLNEQWAECMHSVRAAELTRGFQYSYVAFARVDHPWQAYHPGLEMLEATKCQNHTTVWAVAEDDYGGIMDKYFIMQRSGAPIIESFVDVLNSFEKLEAIYRVVRLQASASASLPWNYERFLLHTLRAAGVCIRYMVPVVGHRLLSAAFGEILHQGGRWEVTPAEPYLKMGWCKHLPKYCCGGRMEDFGGDLSCLYNLWRTHGRCRRHRASVEVPTVPGEPAFPPGHGTFGRKETAWANSERCVLRTFQLRACCQQPHVHITLRPSNQTIKKWAESPDVDPEISSSLGPARWHCLSEDPYWIANNRNRPWRLIGAAQCYDLNLL